MQTVLIADPSEIFADALAGMLRKDHRVHICHTGEAALRLLEELRPGALVIDLTLPILDGFDVLRATAYTPPVIWRPQILHRHPSSLPRRLWG